MTSHYKSAYVVAARRTAIGRLGGLHRSRRIEDLTAPIIAAALEDCRLAPGDVDEILIGNASAGGNPARLIALVAGLADRTPALTLDRQCASGLDAILAAIRQVAAGESRVVVAGGAESLSTAPWRVARPLGPHRLPRFLGHGSSGMADDGEVPDGSMIDAAETLAREFQITRQRQDGYAGETREQASRAERQSHFTGEIVALKARAEDARDEAMAHHPEAAALEGLAAYLEPEGTVSPGNSIGMYDGAAIAIVVSEDVFRSLGNPPAMRLIASAAVGQSPGAEAKAPIEAVQKLQAKLNGSSPKGPVVTELGETTAVQAIAFRDSLGIDPALLNPDGGGLARGHVFGATGAVLVARLFTHLVRRRKELGLAHGQAVLGTLGGLGVAALFESV